MSKIKFLLPFLVVVLMNSFLTRAGEIFFKDFQAREAKIPQSEEYQKTSKSASSTLFLHSRDTMNRVSRDIFGNSLAVWTGDIYDDPKLVEYIDKLSPSLIRYPGGSWSDYFFWNGDTSNNTIPDSIKLQGEKTEFEPRIGMGGWETTVDQYYRLRNKIGTEGLITINYGYARYGRGEDPVADAAHLAAEWVRYDNGRTKYWEIGNENAGPWEPGQQIDTSKNKDGQPEVINGKLYGKHFKVFVDSMRKTANEIGTNIHIGAQVIAHDASNSWNPVARDWNEGVYTQVGDTADYYVTHSYLGPEGSGSVSQYLDGGNTPETIMDYLQNDFKDKNAAELPVAITEWNLNAIGSGAEVRASNVNGLQATIAFNEMIANGFGMSARWLLVNWGKDGIFYKGDDESIPEWNPRPAFFYIYYLQKYTGDHMISSEFGSKNKLSAYATKFKDGEIGVSLVNKGTDEEIVSLNAENYGVGNNYYIYSLKGKQIDDEDQSIPQGVSVNDIDPNIDNNRWGPIDSLEKIKARKYTLDGQIKFKSPPRSAQFVLIESGDNKVTKIKGQNKSGSNENYKLYQNYPNPFNPVTNIDFVLPEREKVEIKTYNIKGQMVESLVNQEKSAGHHTIKWNAKNLPSGMYFIKMKTSGTELMKKCVLLK